MCSLSLCLCLCVSVCLSVCLSLSLYLSLSLSLSLCFWYPCSACWMKSAFFMEHIISSDWYPVPQSLFQAFGNQSKVISYNLKHCYLHVSRLFSILLQFPSISQSFHVFLLNFHFVVRCNCKIYSLAILFFLLILGMVPWQGLGNPLVSQSRREFYASHFLGQTLVCRWLMAKF